MLIVSTDQSIVKMRIHEICTLYVGRDDILINTLYYAYKNTMHLKEKHLKYTSSYTSSFEIQTFKY